MHQNLGYSHTISHIKIMFFSTTDTSTFKLRISVETTGDICVIRGIKKHWKVADLKEKIEDLIGIPSYLLQLYYLDECALVDSKALTYFHILPDVKLKARVWATNRRLVFASRNGNWEAVKEELQDQFNDSKYSNNSITSDDKEISHDLDRPLTALFIACFHGKDELVEKLLESGVNPRRNLPSGRHALAVAAVRGHMRCVELLLRRKVRPYEWTHERSSLSNWEIQDRIKDSLDRIEKRTSKLSSCTFYTRLTNSQKYDSSLSTWYQGRHGQLYLCEILDSTDHNLRKQKIKKQPIFKP